MKKLFTLISVFAVVLLGMANSVHAAIVTYDPITGVVAFFPGELVQPVILAIVAAVTAAAAIWVIIAGVTWLRRFMK